MKTNTTAPAILTLKTVKATCKALGFTVKSDTAYNVLIITGQEEFDLGHTFESRQQAYADCIRYCELQSTIAYNRSIRTSYGVARLRVFTN